MRKKWWKPGVKNMDLRAVVEHFAGHPQDLKYSALHMIGEAFNKRVDEGGKRQLPPSLKDARTLNRLAAAYRRPLPEFQRLNKHRGWVPDEPIAEGREVRVPDPDFVPLLAARLAAEALASPELDDFERVDLIKKLAPLALEQFTALDAVLARLLLAAKSR